MTNCPICHKPIAKGEGRYMFGTRIHRKCASLANIKRYSLLAKRGRIR